MFRGGDELGHEVEDHGVSRKWTKPLFSRYSGAMKTLFAYKLLDQPQWKAWKESGLFTGSPDDLRDGFIHLSTAEQTAETAARYFGAVDPLVLAMVDLAAVADALRWEPSRGGALFPHVHGSIPFAAVAGHSLLRLDADGRHVFPQGF